MAGILSHCILLSNHYDEYFKYIFTCQLHLNKAGGKKRTLKQKWVWVDWKKERKKTKNQKNDLHKHKTA